MIMRINFTYKRRGGLPGVIFLSPGKEVTEMSKTFAQRLNNAKNMLAGLTAHVEDLSKRGITAESITEGTALYDKAIYIVRFATMD
jgi:hypothetical protein